MIFISAFSPNIILHPERGSKNYYYHQNNNNTFSSLHIRSLFAKKPAHLHGSLLLLDRSLLLLRECFPLLHQLLLFDLLTKPTSRLGCVSLLVPGSLEGCHVTIPHHCLLSPATSCPCCTHSIFPFLVLNLRAVLVTHATP